jgi:hypothetical protein
MKRKIARFEPLPARWRESGTALWRPNHLAAAINVCRSDKILPPARDRAAP